MYKNTLSKNLKRENHRYENFGGLDPKNTDGFSIKNFFV